MRVSVDALRIRGCEDVARYGSTHAAQLQRVNGVELAGKLSQRG